jgi:hypothetical protein
MVLSDRLLTAVAYFLGRDDEGFPEVRIRDWAGDLSEMEVILDCEDDPEEDGELRGVYELKCRLSLRCGESVAEEDRRAMFEVLDGALGDVSEGDEWELVRWLREEEPGERGIGAEALGIYEMMKGAGNWEFTDDEAVGVIDFTVLAVGVNLTEENFG